MRRNALSALFFSIAASLSVAVAAGQQQLGQNGAPEAEEIYDVYPPVPLPDPVNWPLYLAGIMILLILAAVLFWFLRRRRKEGVATIDPQAEALAAIDGARKLIDDDQPLVYADEASEILRRFIEKKFSIASTRQTTTEFLGTLSADSEGSKRLLPFRDELKHCLASCDLAKYARKPAEREQLEEIDRAIRIFITSAGEES